MVLSPKKSFLFSSLITCWAFPKDKTLIIISTNKNHLCNFEKHSNLSASEAMLLRNQLLENYTEYDKMRNQRDFHFFYYLAYFFGLSLLFFLLNEKMVTPYLLWAIGLIGVGSLVPYIFNLTMIFHYEVFSSLKCAEWLKKRIGRWCKSLYCDFYQQKNKETQCPRAIIT